MVNSIGSSGSSANMWSISRSTGSQATSSTEGSRKSPSAELFSKLDSDGSGGLSSTELQSFVDAMSRDTRGALLATQEASGSSAAATTGADMLSAMDADGDGSVSESELDTHMKANGPQGGPPPPPGEAAAGTDAASDLFGAIDADGSGSVSEGELSDFLAAMKSDGTTSSDETASTSEASETFDAIDTDQDGSISQAELAAYMKTQAASAPPPPPPPEESEVTTDADASSTSSLSSTDASDDLARRLAAALAQFASEAYGRVQATPDASSLFSSVA